MQLRSGFVGGGTVCWLIVASLTIVLPRAAVAVDSDDAARARIADSGDAARVARSLAGAIRFETVSHEDPSEFESAPFLGLMAYLRDRYPRTHAALRLETVNDYTLLYEWPGGDAPLAPARFMAQTDVVPVEGAALEQWSVPPFAGAIRDGHVWGRGAIDVKVGVILWLEAVEALLARGFAPQRTIYLSFGHDEEIGGNAGAKVVAARLAVRGVRLAFLFDEGGFLFDDHPLLPDRVVAQIITAEKAYLTVRLRARGVSGHSSMPPRSTAIGRVARAIHRIETHPMPARLTSPMRQMFEAAAPHLSWSRRFAFRNLWLMGGAVKRRLDEDPLTRAQLRTTFAATLIEGGVKGNVIPESAQATVNVRLLPGDSEEEVVAHLRRVIDDEQIEIESELWGEPAAPASPEGPAFRLAAEAVRAVLPEAVALPGLIPGATDSRHFAGISDEIVRFIPARIPIGLASGAHGRDERIPIAFLDDSVEIAIGMMRRAAAPE